ncbi:ABC transporter substrate-binding protein [Sphingobium sp. Z007]|uniref:ABC transporter substrate-binding protein n=3 Tax=Sphingobium TaxID=165695 RepID=UPI000B4A2FAC|nr:ABC transporter substrate-binding protein [Sphingobium sp. Z007]
MKRVGILVVVLMAVLPISVGSAAHPPASPAQTLPAPAQPGRVMSMNQCTDQLVLALLPPERIASVTWLSRNPGGSLMADQAKRVGVNHGLAEEIIRQKPDLVVAGSFTTPATRGLLKRLGFPMIEVGAANNFAEIRTITRQVAMAVGEQARGEALIVRMDAQLNAIPKGPRRPIRVAAWDGSGFNAARGTLYDAILHAAGAENVANQPPALTYGAPDAEVLLKTAPALLVQGMPTDEKPGLRANLARHPLVRQYWAGARTVHIRQAWYICGTPMVGDAVLALQGQLRTAMADIKSPLPFAVRKATK